MIHAILAVGAFFAVQSDEPDKILSTREYSVPFQVADVSGVKRQILWVSTDKKKTWKPWNQMGFGRSEWSALDGDVIRVKVRFPADGDYWLYGQFGDSVTNMGPAPSMKSEPVYHFRVRLKSPIESGPQVLQPRLGTTVVAGSRIVVKWKTEPEGDFQKDSAVVYYRFEHTGWRVIKTRQPLSKSDFVWTVPGASGQELWLRVSVLNQKGAEVSNISGTIWVHEGARPSPPRLFSPIGGEQWEAGRGAKIRWSAGEGSWVENGSTLYYRIGEGPWIPIKTGLANTDFFLWSPPRRKTGQLQIRVGMKTLDRHGEIFSPPSGNIRVSVRVRGDKKSAMIHYDRARLLHAQKKAPEAIAKYEMALESWPEYPEALHELGRLYYEEEEYARALEYFLQSRDACPSQAAPYVNSAKAEIKLGLYGEALTDLKDAVELGVDRNRRLALVSGETLWKLAGIFKKNDQPDLAVDACQHILRIRHADRKVKEMAESFLKMIVEGKGR